MTGSLNAFCTPPGAKPAWEWTAEEKAALLGQPCQMNERGHCLHYTGPSLNDHHEYKWCCWCLGVERHDAEPTTTSRVYQPGEFAALEAAAKAVKEVHGPRVASAGHSEVPLTRRRKSAMPSPEEFERRTAAILARAGPQVEKKAAPDGEQLGLLDPPGAAE